MWVLSNHDITRHVTRLGRAAARGSVQVFGRGPQRARGPRARPPPRPRRAAARLALPGGVYLYQGEELGLEEVEDLPDDAPAGPDVGALRGTPSAAGTAAACRCRGRPRGPRSGSAGRPQPWLPQPAGWAQLSVEAQDGDPDSMLTLYRQALHLRRELPALGAGTGRDVRWLDMGTHVVAFAREPRFLCVVNTGAESLPLPWGELLLASDPVFDGGELPTDTAAWLRTP